MWRLPSRIVTLLAAPLGLGLPGAARIMDSLEIKSQPGSGRHGDGQEMGEATCKTESRLGELCPSLRW